MSVAEQRDNYPNNEKQCFERKGKKMMQLPQPDPLQYEAVAELKLREQERLRDLNTYPEETSRLSRRAYVLMLLTVMLLIIIGMVIVYNFLL